MCIISFFFSHAVRLCVHTPQAPDGFHGKYDEVVAHEKKFGLRAGEASRPETPSVESKDDSTLFHVYEAEDGFRGSYEEVVAHEKKMGLATGSEHTAVDKQNNEIYEVA